MNLKEIQRRVDEIRANKQDNELAHKLEDELYVDFVRYLSTDNDVGLATMAEKVLETKSIKFNRWYA